MDTVLIANRDLGFVFWLAQRLTQLGHQALPALSIAHAATLVEQFEFNILMIDPSLPRSRGFIHSMQRRHPHLRILVLPSNADARFENLRDLELALRQTPVPVPHKKVSNQSDHPESLDNRLAAPRAALTGVLVGAAVWAALLVLVTPK